MANRINWVDGQTELSAANLNNIEDRIDEKQNQLTIVSAITDSTLGDCIPNATAIKEMRRDIENNFFLQRTRVNLGSDGTVDLSGLRGIGLNNIISVMYNGISCTFTVEEIGTTVFNRHYVLKNLAYYRVSGATRGWTYFNPGETAELVITYFSDNY